MNGIQSFLEVLAAAKIDRIFGNPGTTELPLNDAIVADKRFEYVLGIHEIPVVSMADGYAMASGRPAVVNVHVACGLGNAMGMLYNAHIEGTPLLITAGQQDRRLAFNQPVLWGDLTAVTRPWTKWSYEIQRPEDIAPATRRALQIAMTPPTGPVFLSLPVDIQMAELPDDSTLFAPANIATRVRGDTQALRALAKSLSTARNPVILAGSRVTESGRGDTCGAPSQLASLAETLGATVYTEATSSHGRLPIDSSHALYGGRLPLWSNDLRSLLEPFDLVLVVGMNLFRLYIHEEGPDQPFDLKKQWAQIDCNADELGKNFPTQHAILGDITHLLADLRQSLAEIGFSSTDSEAKIEEAAQRRATEQTAWDESLLKSWNDTPMSADVLMGCVCKTLPPGAVVVEEAVTTHGNRLEMMGLLQHAEHLFAHRGWALGWGIGCALGAQMAWPEKTVLALIGDGAALYGIQGLWSAARYQLPVVFVICNNRQYKILKDCTERMPLPRLREHGYIGMDLTEPDINFVKLSESLGVDARHIGSADEFCDALRDAYSTRRPCLLDVSIGHSTG
jgi:benzoylformate decarboxylase